MHRQLSTLTLALFVLTCCTSNGQSSSSSADAAVQQPADAVVAATCAPVPLLSNDLDGWRSNTVQWLRDAGYSQVSSEKQSGDTVHISARVSLSGDAEPEEAAMSWLSTVPGFPVAIGEMEILEVKQILETTMTVVVGRSHVGTTATHFARPVASFLLVKETDWSVASFRVWGSIALINSAEVQGLVACSTEAAPPRHLIDETNFSGLAMRACALVGDYEYQPNASDVVTFSESLDWIALSDEATEGGTLTQWRTRRTATLEIDASNHWSTIQEADFFCGYDHEIGFEIEVDATSGEVFSFRPGINCVVC